MMVTVNLDTKSKIALEEEIKELQLHIVALTKDNETLVKYSQDLDDRLVNLRTNIEKYQRLTLEQEEQIVALESRLVWLEGED